MQKEKATEFAKRLQNSVDQSKQRRHSRFTLWSMAVRDDVTVLVIFAAQMMYSILNAASMYLRFLLSLVIVKESGRAVGSAPVRWEVTVARAAAKVIIAILFNAMVISAAIVVPIARLGAALMKTGDSTVESKEPEVAVKLR
ncbi:hypothetical protein FI667_g3038, partial [Globisporangium splendens]